MQHICHNADPSRIFPRTLRINEGWKAEFECVSSNDVAWYSYPPETSILYGYGSILFIEDVELEDQGYYECKGVSEDGGTFHALSKLEVNGTCSGEAM